MSKKQILIEEDSELKGIEIYYPFCFKYSKKNYDETNYYRYLEDGRFEHICIQSLQMTMMYGNRTNSIYALVGDHDFYFKQIQQRNEIITSEEFEEKRAEYFSRYQDYLNGTNYIATDVQRMIQNSTESMRKDSLLENGIITNNDIEDEPF